MYPPLRHLAVITPTLVPIGTLKRDAGHRQRLSWRTGLALCSFIENQYKTTWQVIADQHTSYSYDMYLMEKYKDLVAVRDDLQEHAAWVAERRRTRQVCSLTAAVVS